MERVDLARRPRSRRGKLEKPAARNSGLEITSAVSSFINAIVCWPSKMSLTASPAPDSFSRTETAEAEASWRRRFHGSMTSTAFSGQSDRVAESTERVLEDCAFALASRKVESAFGPRCEAGEILGFLNRQIGRDGSIPRGSRGTGCLFALKPVRILPRRARE